MKRRALLAYPLLELLAVWGMVALIGWGWTLLVLLACIPVGFAVMRSAGEHAFADLRDAGSGGFAPGQGSRHAMRFAAGLLIAIPGPLTTIVGLVLLTPLGQGLARRWLTTRFTAMSTSGRTSASTPGFASGDVVPGTVVDPDVRQEPSRPGELDS